jgi:hypothetical protein
LNLLQTVADGLIEQGLVKNYSDFSRIYCGLTENYYYRQKHFSRDYSLEALINTCIKLRRVNRHYDKFATVFESEKNTLSVLEDLVRAELLNKYRIKELDMR